MYARVLSGIGVVGAILAAPLVLQLAAPALSGQTQTPSAPSGAAANLKTPWGEPDLQGIWTYEYDTPLQRPAKYGSQEFFTPEQEAELDKARAELLGRDKRVERGSQNDVAGAYNAVFNSVKHLGRRTSLIVDPPNGQLPPAAPEIQKVRAEDRAFRAALLQSTDTCKKRTGGCAGGTYNAALSPKFAELAPRYNTQRMNRFNGPEDGSQADRCLSDNGGGMPAFTGAMAGSFRRIVQTPGGVTMYYDVGQGQGFQRNIVMDGSPHLPANIRQWFGDSRGHWEGNTLVIDVTNFTPELEYMGSRENLHLVERWRRTSPTNLEFIVKVEDPTVWTAPWTVKQELSKQNDKENRIYYEPRCAEGNYAFPTLLLNGRLADKAFADGKGPRPDTIDNASDFGGGEENPLAR